MDVRLIVIVAVVIVLLFFSMRSDGFMNMPMKTPPHVYTNPKSAYSNEDIAALIDTLRKELSRYQQELPETVAKTLENQVEPSVKGILSRNYYVPQ
jgi:predicted PurR-regulated permease PerM